MLQKALDRLIGERENLTLLEAGCGSVGRLSIPAATNIIGIDQYQQQLDRNTYITIPILGDIQDYQFDADSIDIIVCWDVLEDLVSPEKALLNFCRAIKEDGIIILVAPNRYSLKGIITRLTPNFVHTLFYRHIFSDKRAGKNDQGPFPTFLKGDGPRTYPKVCFGRGADGGTF